MNKYCHETYSVASIPDSKTAAKVSNLLDYLLIILVC